MKPQDNPDLKEPLQIKRTPRRLDDMTVPDRFLRNGNEEISLVELDSDTSEVVETDGEVRTTLASLSIDDDTPYRAAQQQRPPKRKRDKKKRVTKKDSNKQRRKFRKRWIVVPILLLLLIGIGIGGYLYFRASNLFGGNVLSLVTPGATLKTDSEGRTNILVFGTSQDDTAHQNAQGGGGLWLTDSIQIASIDQKNKTVKLVAVPRDLWVGIENCAVGEYAKINAVYECGSDLINASASPGSSYAKQDTTGAASLESVIEETTGLTVQYYVHVNYTVVQKAVDAVGGVDVNIIGDGASGIYDTNFDWDCAGGTYTCKNVYYPTDGKYHLTGKQALFLSRARADTGLYSYKDFGLARGDFDRQANQQKVLIALQAKVKTASVLANPIALNNLIDAFGDNISTDLKLGELKTLLTFAKSLPNTSITQISLVDSGNEVVTTATVSGQSAVVPTSGTYDFSSIIDYLAKQLSTNPAVAEGAKIAVYNASGTSGAASKLQTTLQALGLNVDTIGDADSTDAGSGVYTLYDQTNDSMPKTLAQLKLKLNVKSALTTLPVDIVSGDDFVITVNR